MNLLSPQLHLDISNVILFIANILLIYGVYKDRNILRGFDIRGSSLTALAMLFILSYLGQLGLWFSFYLSVVSFIFWAYVVYCLMTTKKFPPEKSSHVLDALSYLGIPIVVSDHLPEGTAIITNLVKKNEGT